MNVWRDGFEEAERRKARERDVIHEGEALWRVKQRQNWIDRLKDQREARELLTTYNPWGRPGCGAPMEDLRKKKFADLAREPAIPALAMGRPGGGAPLRTKSGKLQTHLKVDPVIRFQDPAKKCVEIEMRYRAPPTQQIEYKSELDAMVLAKRKIEHELWKNCNQEARRMGWNSDPNLSTRDEVKGQNNTTENHENCTALPKTNQGHELVPLLQERHFDVLHSRHPLSTTDVTRLKVPGLPEVRLHEDQDLVHTLQRQVMYKQKKLEELRRREVESCQMHFETWTKFWGRPGHGAPRLNAPPPKFNVNDFFDHELKNDLQISTIK